MNETESVSLKMCREYLGKKVRIIIDQAADTFYEGTQYEINYGYVPGTIAPDGEGLDAYYLSTTEPLNEVEGECIAIIHRTEDDDDKLVLVAEGESFTDEQIEQAVQFREQFFKHTIIR